MVFMGRKPVFDDDESADSRRFIPLSVFTLHTSDLFSVLDHPELAESDYQISGWNRSEMMKEEKNSQMK